MNIRWVDNICNEIVHQHVRGEWKIWKYLVHRRYTVIGLNLHYPALIKMLIFSNFLQFSLVNSQ